MMRWHRQQQQQQRQQQQKHQQLLLLRLRMPTKHKLWNDLGERIRIPFGNVSLPLYCLSLLLLHLHTHTSLFFVLSLARSLSRTLTRADTHLLALSPSLTLDNNSHTHFSRLLRHTQTRTHTQAWRMMRRIRKSKRGT